MIFSYIRVMSSAAYINMANTMFPMKKLLVTDDAYYENISRA
jgi:hypothetical protein